MSIVQEARPKLLREHNSENSENIHVRYIGTYIHFYN